MPTIYGKCNSVISKSAQTNQKHVEKKIAARNPLKCLFFVSFNIFCRFVLGQIVVAIGNPDDPDGSEKKLQRNFFKQY